MDADRKESPASTLVVDESFARQDDEFIERLRTVRNPKYLAGLADRWKQDPRPWAREQIFRYLALPMDRPGHHPVVKRLFKHAESKSDDELMAVFLVAFDRLVRRQRRMRYQYNFQTRQFSQEEVLYTPRDQILPDYNPHTRQKIVHRAYKRVPKTAHLFSYATRSYLRRRVCRYFRRMGFTRPADYPRAIARALEMYRDEDFARGENILDNWSLMNVAFRRSDVLKFSPARVSVAEGRSLGQLEAAPRFENLWKKPESAAELLHLVMHANSRLVRVWATQLLQRHHSTTLKEISAEQLLQLLDNADEQVQQFGANLLKTLSTIDTWPISTWLQLLETKNLTALATICQTMNERVQPSRLNLEQCVALACARVTPVARLGLSWLRGRTIAGDDSLTTIAGLAAARCEAVGAEIATYSLSLLGVPAAYRTERVVAFFDSLNPEIRRGAWDWLTPHSPGYADAALWSRLLETPYDDVRIRLVDELNRRSSHDATTLPAIKDHDLAPVWAAVLLGIHRGGRAKLKALRQISDAIARQPEQAERLLPVLAVAIRSVRLPEARVGLSAILSAVAARPELEPALAKAIPELRLTPQGVAT
jgi:hypothetical protein